jgi:hypothetical protein
MVHMSAKHFQALAIHLSASTPIPFDLACDRQTVRQSERHICVSLVIGHLLVSMLKCGNRSCDVKHLGMEPE